MSTVKKPVLVTAAKDQVTWESSLARSEELKKREREHGPKLKMRPGDEVVDFEGNVGILIHKEFLYANTPSGPGHDVWQLVVQYKAYRRNFSNPSALTLKCNRDDRDYTAMKPSDYLS